MAMFLKYLIRIRSAWRNAVVLFRLRYQGCSIGRSCRINADIKCSDSVNIKDFVNLGMEVSLSSGVSVGSFSALSRIYVGENSQVDRGVLCTGNGNGRIMIGKECYIGINNVLDWSDNIFIGDYVHIAGPSTGVWTHSSARMCSNGVALSNANELTRPLSPVIIENQVYIGGNCTLYPGVTIGENSIVAPNSAVTDNVPPFTLVGGVPARFIKSLK